MEFFAWSKAQPGLFRFFTDEHLQELRRPLRFTVNELKAVLQNDRPICGIVALAMCLENPTEEHVERILHRAKSQRYSLCGEMFSARKMMELTRHTLPDRKVSLLWGYLDSKGIKEYLLKGNLLLVPMDFDAVRNRPGRYKGAKAHWVVLCGAVETPNNFFVVARHGGHPHACLWELSRLAESNAQLRYWPASGYGFRIPLADNRLLGLNMLSIGIDKLSPATGGNDDASGYHDNSDDKTVHLESSDNLSYHDETSEYEISDDESCDCETSSDDETSDSSIPRDHTADGSRRSGVDLEIYFLIAVTLSVMVLVCS